MSLVSQNRIIGPLLASLVAGILTTATSHAIPAWIGVSGGLQRHIGGNPGTFTIQMDQYYPTLHASVGISVNNGSWKEYPMTYGGNGSKAAWTYVPAAAFPVGVPVRYYFRGWDDAGGSISDATAAASYSFVSVAPSVTAIAGDVDVFGAMLSMGSWLDDLNRAGLSVSYRDYGSSAASVVRLSATRQANDWVWERAAQDGSGSVPMLKLDSANRLTLYDPSAIGTGTIVLDPNGAGSGIIINGQRVLTSATAATSYLSVNPVQLTVGANNTAAADSVAVGSFVQASGHNSAALGSGTIASGDHSTAVGDHTTAQGLGQFVAGTYNEPQGQPATAAATDQLFVIGNGTDAAHRSNAVTVLRNGNLGVGTSSPEAKLEVEGDAKVDGNLRVTGTISVPPQGGLSMGEFTRGPRP